MNNIDQFSPVGPDAVKKLNSRGVGQVYCLKVSFWLYNWGYSSACVIQLLLHQKRDTYANKLAENGWLKATETESKIPKHCFTLRKKTVTFVEQYITKEANYKELDYRRVYEPQMEHNLFAQKLTLKAFASNLIERYSTERFISEHGDRSGVKRPDVAWLSKSKLRIGVEVENTEKRSDTLDLFILGIVRALTPEDGKLARYDHFVIFYRNKTPKLIDNYKKAMAPGRRIKVPHDLQSGNWFDDGFEDIPDWLLDRVHFDLIVED